MTERAREDWGADGPYIAPRITLRVGVTGHRPNKLAGTERSLLKSRAAAVLACLARIAGEIAEENARQGETAPFVRADPELRLATMIAEGGDRIVAAAAIEQGYRLNLILPFPRETYETDNESAAALEEFRRLCEHPAAMSRTGLDLRTQAGDPLAYRAGGHLMLAHSDVLIAIWNEDPPDGIGGTAEILSEAQRRGLITVLVTLQGELRIWTGSGSAGGPSEDGRWEPLVLQEGGEPCSDELARRVRAQLAPPGLMAQSSEDSGPEHVITARECLQRYRGQRVPRRGRAAAYDLLHGIFRSRRPREKPAHPAYTPWERTGEAALAIAGPDFRETIDARLRERWARADAVAIYYSNRFRNALVSNFTLAALAVLVGLLAVFWWHSLVTKAIFVGLELMLIVLILRTTLKARRECWSDLWLDSRGLAEALRPARLHILIGSSPARPLLSSAIRSGQGWIAWYVGAALREIAPPSAVIGPEALRAGIEVAIGEEVDAQLRYHRQNADAAAIVDRRLEHTAEYTLWGTLAAGSIYLLLYGAYALSHIEVLVKGYKPVATFLGGTLPVIGAAIFGIRATADFRSASKQSRRMFTELAELRKRLAETCAMIEQNEAEGYSLTALWRQVNQIFSQLSRALSDDVRLWDMIYSERELTPGF